MLHNGYDPCNGYIVTMVYIIVSWTLMLPVLSNEPFISAEAGF